MYRGQLVVKSSVSELRKCLQDREEKDWEIKLQSYFGIVGYDLKEPGTYMKNIDRIMLNNTI